MIVLCSNVIRNCFFFFVNYTPVAYCTIVCNVQFAHRQQCHRTSVFINLRYSFHCFLRKELFHFCFRLLLCTLDTQPCSSAIAFPVLSSDSLQLATESSIHNAIRAWGGSSTLSFIFHSLPVTWMELGPGLSKLDGSWCNCRIVGIHSSKGRGQ